MMFQETVQLKSSGGRRMQLMTSDWTRSCTLHARCVCCCHYILRIQQALSEELYAECKMCLLLPLHLDSETGLVLGALRCMQDMSAVAIDGSEWCRFCPESCTLHARRVR